MSLAGIKNTLEKLDSKQKKMKKKLEIPLDQSIDQMSTTEMLERLRELNPEEYQRMKDHDFHDPRMKDLLRNTLIAEDQRANLFDKKLKTIQEELNFEDVSRCSTPVANQVKEDHSFRYRKMSESEMFDLKKIIAFYLRNLYLREKEQSEVINIMPKKVKPSQSSSHLSSSMNSSHLPHEESVIEYHKKKEKLKALKDQNLERFLGKVIGKKLMSDEDLISITDSDFEQDPEMEKSFAKFKESIINIEGYLSRRTAEKAVDNVIIQLEEKVKIASLKKLDKIGIKNMLMSKLSQKLIIKKAKISDSENDSELSIDEASLDESHLNSSSHKRSSKGTPKNSENQGPIQSFPKRNQNYKKSIFGRQSSPEPQEANKKFFIKEKEEPSENSGKDKISTNMVSGTKDLVKATDQSNVTSPNDISKKKDDTKEEIWKKLAMLKKKKQIEKNENAVLERSMLDNDSDDDSLFGIKKKEEAPVINIIKEDLSDDFISDLSSSSFPASNYLKDYQIEKEKAKKSSKNPMTTKNKEKFNFGKFIEDSSPSKTDKLKTPPKSKPSKLNSKDKSEKGSAKSKKSAKKKLFKMKSSSKNNRFLEDGQNKNEHKLLKNAAKFHSQIMKKPEFRNSSGLDNSDETNEYQSTIKSKQSEIPKLDLSSAKLIQKSHFNKNARDLSQNMGSPNPQKKGFCSNRQIVDGKFKGGHTMNDYDDL